MVVPWNILICMPSLNPAKSSAKAHTCHWWGMCMGRGSKWGWDCQSFEASTNQRSAGSIPIGLWAGSLMEFMRQVLKSMALCWVPNPYVWNIHFSALSLSQAFNCANHLSILSEVRKYWTSQAATYTARETRHSLTTFLLFPVEEVMGWGSLSWHWTVLPWGKDDAGKLILFFLILFNVFSEFLF